MHILFQKRISIPYGAIKSNKLEQYIDPSVQFQFLMVRLKDINMMFIMKIINYFNSLWCD